MQSQPPPLPDGQPPYYPPPYQQPPPYGYYRPFRLGLAARMGKPLRVLIGIGTFLPLVAFASYFAFIFSVVFRSLPPSPGRTGSTTPTGAVNLAGFGAVFALMGITAIAAYGLVVLFIIDIVKNDRLDEGSKIGWTLGLFFANFLVLPVYWFLYFWRVPTQPPQPPQPPPPYAPAPPPGAFTPPTQPPETRQ